MLLGCKFIPQLDGELAVGYLEGANESIFEYLDGSLCGVDPVVVWFDQLECHLLWGEVCLDSFGGLIVHDVYFQFEPFAHQIFKVGAELVKKYSSYRTKQKKNQLVFSPKP